MAGKTALIHRFTDNFFDEKSMSTLATDFVIVEKKFKYKKDEAKVKVKVWDSPGQDRFESFVVNALKNTQGIIQPDLNSELWHEVTEISQINICICFTAILPNRSLTRLKNTLLTLSRRAKRLLINPKL